jgi:CheY-like chemotaxis protein
MIAVFLGEMNQRVQDIDRSGQHNLSAIIQGNFACAVHPYMTVDEAPDGEQALQKIDSFRPDLIFMDIVVPGEHGLEVTKK